MEPPGNSAQAAINAVARFRAGGCYDSHLGNVILNTCPLLRLE